MNGPNLVHTWVNLLGLLVMIGVILTDFGLMLGVVKTASAMKHLDAIVSIVIALMLIPGILGNAWRRLGFLEYEEYVNQKV